MGQASEVEEVSEVWEVGEVDEVEQVGDLTTMTLERGFSIEESEVCGGMATYLYISIASVDMLEVPSLSRGISGVWA
jgi:hypothetical protein